MQPKRFDRHRSAVLREIFGTVPLFDCSRGSHSYVPCTSICDGDFTDILIPYATHERKEGVTTHVRLYTHSIYCKKSTDQDTRKARSSDQGMNQAIKGLFWRSNFLLPSQME